MKKKAFIFTLIGLMALFGCDKLFPKKPLLKPPVVSEEQPSFAVKGTIIAKVDNQPIILEDLNNEIDQWNKLRPEAKIDTKDKKLAYLKEEMVQRVLLAQAAMDRGLDKKEEVHKTLENVKQQLLSDELLKEEYANIDVTSTEIENFYNQFKEELKEPEERWLREIVVATEGDVKDVMIELLKGGDFAGLAQMKSIASSAKKGGDLGYLKKGVKSPQFDEAAFSTTLEPGKTSNYFKGPDGYYILKLEAKKGGQAKSLKELRDDIKNLLVFSKQEQKKKELVSKFSEKAKIEVFEAAVK